MTKKTTSRTREAVALAAVLAMFLAACASQAERSCKGRGYGYVWNDGLQECHKTVYKTPDGYWPPD